MRLQKFLAQASVGSRRKCENIIKSGKILVNGKRATLGQTINPEKDRVTLDGKIIKPEPHDYILLYKPRGFLSTASDPFGRPIVLDLAKRKGRIYPVGRLDKDSEGLMLLTNDGDLAYRLTHPSFEIEKTYEVLVKGIPSRETMKKIESGIVLDDGKTAPCRIRILNVFEGEKKTRLEIKIHEGKKREIRRMMAKVGHGVMALCRTEIGPLKLSGVSRGEWRTLTGKEIQDLKKCVEKNV